MSGTWLCGAEASIRAFSVSTRRVQWMLCPVTRIVNKLLLLNTGSRADFSGTVCSTLYLAPQAFVSSITFPNRQIFTCADPRVLVMVCFE